MNVWQSKDRYFFLVVFLNDLSLSPVNPFFRWRPLSWIINSRLRATICHSLFFQYVGKSWGFSCLCFFTFTLPACQRPPGVDPDPCCGWSSQKHCFVLGPLLLPIAPSLLKVSFETKTTIFYLGYHNNAKDSFGSIDHSCPLTTGTPKIVPVFTHSSLALWIVKWGAVTSVQGCSPKGT